MLTDRRQIILRALIEEYILRAIPVASKTLVDNYDLSVSSATVRNDLNFLENSGYIMQPHTSAGRIPTEFGYREFVDQIINGFEESQETEEPVESERVSEIRKSADEVDNLLDQLSIELARLTDCLSVISPKKESGQNVHIAKRGISSMLKQPEFRDSSNILPIMEILEDDSILFDTLQASATSNAVTVRIGHENESKNLSGVSVITAQFGTGKNGGVVAVIGPTRMNYAEVIKAVTMAQNVLDDID